MRNLTRMFGVALVAALGVLAVSAAMAQAGSMQVNVEGTLLTEEMTGAGTAGAGKLLIPSQTELEIVCTAASGTAKAKNEATEVVKGSVKLVFTGCVYQNSKNCIIYPTAAALLEKKRAGEIEAEGEAKVALDGSKNLFVFGEGPGVSKRFASVFAAQEGGCTISEKIEVKGNAALAIPNGTGQATTLAEKHEITDATAAEETALGKALGITMSLKYGANPAELDAGTSTDLHLTGKHNLLKYKLEP